MKAFSGRMHNDHLCFSSCSTAAWGAQLDLVSLAFDAHGLILRFFNISTKAIPFPCHTPRRACFFVVFSRKEKTYGAIFLSDGKVSCSSHIDGVSYGVPSGSYSEPALEIQFRHLHWLFRPARGGDTWVCIYTPRSSNDDLGEGIT